MNHTEEFSNVPNTSEDFRSVLHSSEDFSTLQSTSKRTSGVGRGKKYAGAEVPDHNIGHDFLIMEQAYTVFESEGERRSVRMIAEYCKTGELVCDYDTDDKRWHITRESVEHKIAKIKALNARKAAAAPQSTSEPFSEAPTTSHRATEQLPPSSEPTGHSSGDFKKLEQEILNLKITNKAKDYFIEQMQKERVEFIDRIEKGGRIIGRLKARLLELMPGRPTPGNDTNSLPVDSSASPRESNVYRDVEDVSSSLTNDPTSSVSPNEPLADNPIDNYEHSLQ